MNRFEWKIGLFAYLLFVVFSVKAQQDTASIPPFIDVGNAQLSVIEVEWAAKVVNYSSEYSSKEKSANQVLGKPNVLPLGGSSPCAWTYNKKAKNGDEYIRVAFKKPIKARQIGIAESFKPGAVEKITLYGKNPGEEKVVYQSDAVFNNEKFRMMNVFFDETPFEVSEAEIRLNSSKVSNFEIDAIGISNLTDSIKARINIPPNMKYLAQKESLGPNINTEYDERAPIISADEKEIYFDRKNSPGNVGGVNDEDDIWYSKMVDGKWIPALNIGPPLNNPLDNFVQSITPDGNMLLLANVYVKDGNNVNMKPGVSVSYKSREGWSFPEEQKIHDFKNNSPYVNYFLSANSKYLLMAIETDAGYGGLDLYVSFRVSDNVWSSPINLGPQINTSANDYSPFLAADGITLYYSTAGHSGYGKEDIFVTRRLDDTWKNWSEPMNMGQPINSSESDTKFSIPASGSYAYFSSSNGSVGLNDIFRILLPDTVKPQTVVLLKGKIIDFSTKTPIGGAIIIYKDFPKEAILIKEKSDSLTGNFSVYLPIGNKYTALIKAKGYVDGKQSLDLTSIYNYTVVEQQPISMVKRSAFKTFKGKISDKLTDKTLVGAKLALLSDSVNGKVLAVTYVNDKGEYEFKVENIGDDEKLFLQVDKENYTQKTFELGDVSNETDIPLDITLEPEIKKDKVIEFHNIYFDFGSAEIKDTAKVVLDRIVNVMNENPTLEIELSGHTDSKSSADFNMKLSQRRADAAKVYIVSKGINEARIVAKGYGFTRLLNKCKPGVQCTEAEHAINRRIEVKVLKL
jgi:outer membrane protein OmpA-like peptidoglycan-associated protein